MRLSVVTFIVSLGVWGVIAVWNEVRIYELLRTWQIIAVDLAIVSGLVMLALLVHAAWLRLRRQTWSSSARGAGPRASSRSRGVDRSRAAAPL